MNGTDAEWEEFKRSLTTLQKTSSVREQLNVLSAQLNEIEQDTKVLPEIKEALDADQTSEENEEILQNEDPTAMMQGAMGGGMPPMGGGMPTPEEEQAPPEDERASIGKADLAGGVDTTGTEPMADAVNLDTGDDKVQALFEQLIAALSESSHQALDAGDVGKLMKLTNAQANLSALLESIVPLLASVPENELGGGEPVMKAKRNFSLAQMPATKPVLTAPIRSASNIHGVTDPEVEQKLDDALKNGGDVDEELLEKALSGLQLESKYRLSGMSDEDRKAYRTNLRLLGKGIPMDTDTLNQLIRKYRKKEEGFRSTSGNKAFPADYETLLDIVYGGKENLYNYYGIDPADDTRDWQLRSAMARDSAKMDEATWASLDKATRAAYERNFLAHSFDVMAKFATNPKEVNGTNHNLLGMGKGPTAWVTRKNIALKQAMDKAFSERENKKSKDWLATDEGQAHQKYWNDHKNELAEINRLRTASSDDVQDRVAEFLDNSWIDVKNEFGDTLKDQNDEVRKVPNRYAKLNIPQSVARNIISTHEKAIADAMGAARGASTPQDILKAYYNLVRNEDDPDFTDTWSFSSPEELADAITRFVPRTSFEGFMQSLDPSLSKEEISALNPYIDMKLEQLQNNIQDAETRGSYYQSELDKLDANEDDRYKKLRSYFYDAAPSEGGADAEKDWKAKKDWVKIFGSVDPRIKEVKETLKGLNADDPANAELIAGLTRLHDLLRKKYAKDNGYDDWKAFRADQLRWEDYSGHMDARAKLRELVDQNQASLAKLREEADSYKGKEYGTGRRNLPAWLVSRGYADVGVDSEQPTAFKYSLNINPSQEEGEEDGRVGIGNNLVRSLPFKYDSAEYRARLEGKLPTSGEYQAINSWYNLLHRNVTMLNPQDRFIFETDAEGTPVLDESGKPVLKREAIPYFDEAYQYLEEVFAEDPVRSSLVSEFRKYNIDPTVFTKYLPDLDKFIQSSTDDKGNVVLTPLAETKLTKLISALRDPLFASTNEKINTGIYLGDSPASLVTTSAPASDQLEDVSKLVRDNVIRMMRSKGHYNAAQKYDNLDIYGDAPISGNDIQMTRAEQMIDALKKIEQAVAKGSHILLDESQLDDQAKQVRDYYDRYLAATDKKQWSSEEIEDNLDRLAESIYGDLDLIDGALDPKYHPMKPRARALEDFKKAYYSNVQLPENLDAEAYKQWAELEKSKKKKGVKRSAFDTKQNEILDNLDLSAYPEYTLDYDPMKQLTKRRNSKIRPKYKKPAQENANTSAKESEAKSKDEMDLQAAVANNPKAAVDKINEERKESKKKEGKENGDGKGKD